MKQSLVGGKKSCLELFCREFQRDIQKRPKQLQKGTTFQHTENTNSKPHHNYSFLTFHCHVFREVYYTINKKKKQEPIPYNE